MLAFVIFTLYMDKGVRKCSGLVLSLYILFVGQWTSLVYVLALDWSFIYCLPITLIVHMPIFGVKQSFSIKRYSFGERTLPWYLRYINHPHQRKVWH